jgi:hypothetical protein
MNRTVSTCVLALAGVAFITGGAAAHGPLPHGDISPYAFGGTIRTNLISEDETTTTPGVRVFFAELGEDVPGEGTLSFRFNRALKAWNGTDFVGTTARMSLSFGPLGPVTTPLTDLMVTGFGLPIDEHGGLHDHPDYLLEPGASDGIYLLDISFFSDDLGLSASEPVWILFGRNASEEDAEAAYDHAMETIPAPGVAMTLLGGAWMLGRRRRR